MTRTDFTRALDDYRARYPDEEKLADAMLDLAQGWPDCFSRHHFQPGHFTGSAWVLDPEAGKVLLTHHRRLNRWLQLGGHSEGEDDIFLIARREAVEESGLKPAQLVSGGSEIFDIDIHPIPPGKGEPAHYHFDVRFLFHAHSGHEIEISDESHDLAWISLDELESYTVEDSMLRMKRKTAGDN